MIGRHSQSIFKSSIIFLGVISLAEGAEITQLGFKGNESPNVLEIRTNGPVEVDKQENEQDKQVVLEIKGAKLPKALSRKIDTSSFDSNVSLISPYQVLGDQNTVRIVLQMRGPGGADVNQDGNLVRVTIPTGMGGGSNNTSNDASSNAPSDSALSAIPDMPPPPINEQDSTDVVIDRSSKKKNSDSPPPSASPSRSNKNDRLDEFITSIQTKRFTGRPITLNLRDVEVTDAFRLIAEASGFNIVVGDGVGGKISLSLTDVPWDQALDVILHTMRLGAERNHNILRIVTLKDLTEEKREELSAKSAVEASAPRITRIFPISFAKIDDLQQTLNRFLYATAAASGVNAATGAVLTDNRTNSIIVLDTPANVERMKKLIELLDTQTPQVLIEAKVIEATETFLKTITGNLGVGSIDATSQFFGSFNTPSLNQPYGAVTATTTTLPSLAAPNTIGASIISSPFRVNAILSMQESEGKLKVISTPKTVVLNKEKATILQSFPALGPSTVTVVAGAQTTTPTVVQANLSLEVVPAVTNEGSIALELNLNRDTIQSLGVIQGIEVKDAGRRNLKTNVLVESGSTLVIGGIHTSEKQESSGGFPILRKIPILGPLFGNDSVSENRSELFFFITPRILNSKEAGITG
jgi:type IV pilus assembly protein PilQ